MFRFTIRDVLWLTVVVALSLGLWRARLEVRRALEWRNRTGTLEAVLADQGLSVEWDGGAARIRDKDGKSIQTLLIEAFPPKSDAFDR